MRLVPEGAPSARRLLLSAALSGLLAAAALPPFGAWPLAFIAWVPWLLALSGGPSVRAGALSGALHVMTWNAASCSWMVTVMTRHGGIPLPAAIACFALALVILAPYGAVVGAATAYLTRRVGPSGLLGLVLLWPAIDALRCRLPLGFPWALPGMTQVGDPMMAVASEVGIHGVTMLVLALNVVFSAALTPRRSAERRLGKVVLSSLLVVLAAAALGVFELGQGPPERSSARATAVPLDDQGDAALAAALTRAAFSLGWTEHARDGELRVALVQGAVPQEVKLHPDAASELARAELQVALTEAALDAGADVVVWAESAYPETVGRMPWLLMKVRALLASRPDAEVLVGALVDVPGSGDVTNSALLVDADGVAGRYDKTWLVPFGEYVPGGILFSWFRQLAAVGTDMRAGASSDPLPGRALYGTYVCYEAVLPQHVADFSRRGATVLVNVTNDGWFVGTAAAEQHLAFSVARAMELRRTVVRCANSGISAVVDESGQVLAELPEGRRGLVLATVVPRDGLTIYARVGDAPVMLAGLGVLAWLVVVALRERARRGSSEVRQ